MKTEVQIMYLLRSQVLLRTKLKTFELHQQKIEEVDWNREQNNKNINAAKI